MKKRDIFLIILILVAFGLWMAVSYKYGYHQGYEFDKLDSVHQRYNNLSNHTSCGNISKYDTNRSFMVDYYDLLIDLRKCQTNNTDPPNSLHNVDDIDNCNEINIDCEDISFMIDCLAREHNISCRYYTTFAIGKDSHRGVVCNVSGEEKELY